MLLGKHVFTKGKEERMRLLLVEDEEDLIQAMARGLRQEGYAVDLALDGLRGWELLATNAYDLLLLDLNLPDLDGLELCQRVRASYPQVLVLVLTARSTPRHRVLGLDQGADDYLVKPFHWEELLARLRALFRRDLRGRQSVLCLGDLRLDPATRLAWKGSCPLELTRKEFGILEYLLRHPTEVVTQETLLEHVWDRNADPLTTTVRVHINSLRRKLEKAGAGESGIETVVGSGYRIGSALRKEQGT